MNPAVHLQAPEQAALVILGLRGSGGMDCPRNSPLTEEVPAVSVLLTKEVTSA